MTKNAYIHIPFCTKRCNYCSFVSYDTLNLKNIYLDALIKEIKANYKNEKLNTLYVGGGTPSTLSISDFEQLFSLLNYSNNTELTVEINPDGIDKKYLSGLRSLGVNRLSIGVQSFDDKLLKNIGRGHSSAQSIDVVKMAKNAGFKNISVDLIYGLPGQTLTGYMKTLDILLALDVAHVSLYGLKIEEGCNFYNSRPEFLPDDDIQADMYILSNDILTKNGFLHYEISNYALKGFESGHNLNYWDNESYYGFGVSAHGYLDGCRYENESNIDKYLINPKQAGNKLKMTTAQRLEEELFLGFRKLGGLNVSKVNKKFDIDFEKKYKNILDKYLKLEHIKKTPAGYTLTLNGVLLSNTFLCEFVS